MWALIEFCEFLRVIGTKAYALASFSFNQNVYAMMAMYSVHAHSRKSWQLVKHWKYAFLVWIKKLSSFFENFEFIVEVYAMQILVQLLQTVKVIFLLSFFLLFLLEMNNVQIQSMCRCIESVLWYIRQTHHQSYTDTYVLCTALFFICFKALTF